MRIAIYRDTSDPVAGGSTEQGTLLGAVRLAVDRIKPEEVVRVERGSCLNEEVAGKDCLLLVAPQFTERHCELLERLCSPPLVVVTLDPSATALELCQLRVHDVVGPDTEKIEFAVRRAAGSSVFERAASVAQEHPRLSAGLREWLARTLTRWPPYRSVKESAEPTTTAPSTITGGWRSEIGVSTPKEWLGKIQLARGFSIKGHATWSSVAAHLKITLRTLERSARRITGRSLNELDSDLAEFEKEFERYLVDILGGERP